MPTASQSRALVISMIMLAFAGCAALQPNSQQQADNLESTLAASGFKMMPAETPDKLAQIQTLPQLKVKYFPDKDGTIRYWMADGNFCHCVFIGNEPSYQKYQQLKIQQRIANQQQEAAEMQMEAAQEEQMELMNPMLYGPVWIY